MNLKAKCWLTPFRRPCLLLLTTFILLSTSQLLFSATEEGDNSQYLIEKANLYPDRSGGIKSVKDENSSWIAQPHGRIGEIVKGQKVTKVSRIRQRRMSVTLDDGRKGWVDIPLVSPAPGLNAYLFNKVRIQDISAEPNRSSKPALEINDSNKYNSFATNTSISIIDWYYDKEEYAKSLVIWPSSLWAKVKIADETSGIEYVGWLPSSKVRLKGQMHNDALILIWKPIKWISVLLGDGFFAGLLIVVLYFIPVLIGFMVARILSLGLRFLPNFLIYLIIILLALFIYYQVYFSVFDASSFNRGNWFNEFMYIVFAFLTLSSMLGTYKVFYKHTRETRCPSCKYWYGGAFNREHLNTNITTTTTTTKYSDGKTAKSVSEDVEENWKDYCSCAYCGHYWTIYRTEKK
jgi:hypothetical protein